MVTYCESKCQSRGTSVWGSGGPGMGAVAGFSRLESALGVTVG